MNTTLADATRRLRWAIEQIELGDLDAARICLCDLAEELEHIR